MFKSSSHLPRRPRGLRQGSLWRLVGGSGLALLGGCAAAPSLDAPLGWWHDLEGGQIADQRPPPPGSHDPYPNIGTTPARPAASDVARQQRIADQLASQRDAAEAGAARDPLRATPPPPKPPAPAAPDPNGNKVVVDAAPTPAPVAAPATKPSPAPQAKAATPAAPMPSLSEVPAVPAAIASGAMPDFAAGPPPAAQGFGDFAPPPLTVAPTPAPAFVPGGVVVAFSPGSSSLPPSAPATLSKFAQGHRGVPVAVTGRGEAVLRSADAQSRGMDLAFKRVQAIAVALSAAGIPASSLRLHAEAAGYGGSATLLN